MLWSVEFLFCICACDSIWSNVDGDMLLKNCLQSLLFVACVLLLFTLVLLSLFTSSLGFTSCVRVCSTVRSTLCGLNSDLLWQQQLFLHGNKTKQKKKNLLVTESQRKLCAHVCQQPTSLASPGYMWQACLVVMSWLLSLHIYAHPACALLHNECLKHIAL